jgi:hypothetical protein
VTATKIFGRDTTLADDPLRERLASIAK